MNCQGRNKNGQPCKRHCHGKFCYQHQAGKKSPAHSPVPSPRGLKVEIYSKASCPYCVKAKALLTKHHMKYVEYEVDNEKVRNEMVKRTGGAKTVPQIFINHKYIGGYDNLSKLLK